MLKCGLYHFILGDVYLDRVVYPYCKGTWLYSPKIELEGHAVRMHVAWFLRYSTLEEILHYTDLEVHTAKVHGCTHQILNLRVMQYVCTNHGSLGIQR